MPLVELHYKANRGLMDLANELAENLPGIVAPNLIVPERPRHDGEVLPEDIIVKIIQGGTHDVNCKDIEIVIFAHDFPERKANLEERKEEILKGVRAFIESYEAKRRKIVESGPRRLHAIRKHSGSYEGQVSGFVWVLLVPTAFGQL